MYKILYNNITIDVMKRIVYCKSLNNGRTIRTDKMSANCIISSNGEEVYHIVGTPSASERYKSVKIIPIQKDEYDYLQSLITNGKPISVDLITARENKIAEMSAISEQIIYNGTDVTLSDGNTYHFSFTNHDQSKIGFLATAAQTANTLESIGLPTNETGKDYPWHADGGDCVFYSRMDMMAIGDAMQKYITFHNSYFHALRNYINDMTNPLKILEIEYGADVPQQYWGEVYQTIVSMI